MCGIGGVLSYTSAPPSAAQLDAINHAQKHRGPDGAGVHIEGPCGLAHRRLAIIDLSEAASQPMVSTDGRYWLSFNGEIYNYVELRETLKAAGARFRTSSDSEVILEAYAAYGLDAFSKFNGMWAIALWDTLEKELILSRDRFGEKPIYVHRTAERLIFASEIKGILAAEPSLAVPNQRFIAGFLEVPWVGIGRETPFSGIERLPHATTQVFSLDGTERTHDYWDFEPRDAAVSGMSFQDAEQQTLELLTDAIRIRFRSDVPVGTCLSGGLDSSSIVALAARKLGQAPKAFSAIYAASGFEEGEFIEEMNQRFSLDSHRVLPDGSDLPETFAKIAYYQDEPSGGPGLYSQWHVMKRATREVKVLLDGQGGDEVFAGYFPYFDPYTEVLLSRARNFDFGAAWDALRAGPRIRDLTGRDPVRTWLLDAVRRRLPRRVQKANALLRRLRSGQAPSLDQLGPGLIAHARSRNAERSLAPSGNPLTNMLWDQIMRTSVPGLLHYEDRDSMAFSIEARVPFLDHRLVEFAFNLPMEFKIHLDQTKRVLRSAMKGILPEKVRLRRDKKGYPTPFSLWIREPRHRDWLEDLLLGSRSSGRGWVEPRYARQLLDAHLRERADHSWRLWQLMSVEAFARRFFDGAFSAEA